MTAAEKGATTFEITRSDKETVFTALGRVPGKGMPGHYTFYDESPLNGANCYRLNIIDENDAVHYSEVAIARNGRTSGAVTLSPVPAKHKVMLVNKISEYKGKQAGIYRMDGKLMAQVLLDTEHIIDISRWPNGSYVVLLPGSEVLKIVKQ